MAIKKSELYSSLWASCDELRGSMDASQYKDYVLVLLFMKYVSDKGGALVDIPKGGSFKDMVKLKGQSDIGDKINKIIGELAKANDLTGVITVADFNDDEKLGKGKEKVDRLSNLIEIFEKPELDFSSNRAEGDDILGDAYEYLMRHFATESGKSKGQFDYAVANPPFSHKAWMNGWNPANDIYKRSEGYDALPPKKNGDFAFLLHLIKSLKSKGKGCIVMPLGVLFRG